ncbi:MAG: cation-translocating P-type ATPase [Oscillospiraceae bacterium]|nr:cation-translocating P-type ATPase [Oscillospiraceae bacterium]
MIKNAMHKLEEILAIGGTKKDITLLAISGVSLILSLIGLPLPFDIAWVAIILCGVPIILEAIIGLVTEFDIKADVLVSLALVASVLIGETFAAGEVAFIMQLGGLLEELTVAKARAGIERLVRLTPQTARVISGEMERIIPVEEVTVGEILRVLPGETVPVDGVIISGQTSINQAVMTGESLPVDKTVGDEVSSGTVNQFGAFDMRATKVGSDSSIQRLIRLVQSADAGKAKIVGLADRWATWIVVIALVSAALTWAISGEILRAVTILVVFCPCALVLATPTAIMAAIGNATKHGFLVKEGDALERLADVTIATFDKTGTLTYGTPTVSASESLCKCLSDEYILRLCASAEQMSEHPLGKAIVNSYSGELPTCEKFSMLPGRGVQAEVNGQKILAGNREMLQEAGINLSEDATAVAEKYLKTGCTIIYVASESEILGLIALLDTVREESKDMIKKLKSLSVEPVLLTGDNKNTAEAVSRNLGIDKVYSDCLPEDKLKIIGSLQSAGEKILMLGDGVNDAPSLKKTDVGIAMGSIGSDIAVDAADIALVGDDLSELPHLVALSKRMMKTIRLNLTFSMTLNVIAIILAIIGTLNPVVGALVHNAGSVLVIVNSALLLSFSPRAS